MTRHIRHGEDGWSFKNVISRKLSSTIGLRGLMLTSRRTVFYANVKRDKKCDLLIQYYKKMVQCDRIVVNDGIIVIHLL